MTDARHFEVVGTQLVGSALVILIALRLVFIFSSL